MNSIACSITLARYGAVSGIYDSSPAGGSLKFALSLSCTVSPEMLLKDVSTVLSVAVELLDFHSRLASTDTGRGVAEGSDVKDGRGMGVYGRGKGLTGPSHMMMLPSWYN